MSGAQEQEADFKTHRHTFYLGKRNVPNVSPLRLSFSCPTEVVYQLCKVFVDTDKTNKRD